METITNTKEIASKELCGMSISELGLLLGEPYYEYPFKQGIFRLYTHNGHMVMVELSNGIVKNATRVISENRQIPRITPSGTRISYIRVGEELLSGHILDMSAQSISFQLSKLQHLPGKGTIVDFCTNIKIQQYARAYIRLQGEVVRVCSGCLVISLDQTMTTFSYKMYLDYINRKIAFEALTDVIIGVEAWKEPHEVKIMQSDLCFVCTDKYCGIRK